MVSQNIKVAVDAVVFGYAENTLQILLIQQKFGTSQKKWALPGGLVENDESLHSAVIRELKEETGVKINYLEQLYTFGAVERDSRNRVVTVAYLALLNPKNYRLKADTDALNTKWVDIDKAPNLAFDHNKILLAGLTRLQNKIHYQPIGFELLNNEFPFSDIEKLYQTILNRKIDRRNFRKKLLSFGFLEETSKINKAANGRPAKLFRFNKNKYKSLEKKGFNFEIKFA